MDERDLTFTKLDAEGKPLWICDARGNLVMQYITPAKPNHTPLYDGAVADHRPAYDMPANAVPCYDIAGNLLFQHSMDAGDRWMLKDAAGKPMLAWDFNERTLDDGSKRAERRLLRDAVRRTAPADRAVAHDQRRSAGPDRGVRVRGYGRPGAGGARRGTASATSIGQATRHYDPSGLATVERVDFEGSRRGDHAHARPPGRRACRGLERRRPHEPARAGDIHPDHRARRARPHDHALQLASRHRRPARSQRPRRGLRSRVQRARPAGVRDAARSRHQGARCERPCELQQDAAAARNAQAIERVTCDAKGQKLSLELGNGTVTRYTYDPETFRLAHLFTRRDAAFAGDCAGDPDAARPQRPCGVQNLHYTYDPVGNITHIQDDAQDTIWFANQQVEPSSDYVYDALYRLIEATGRENAAAVGAPPHPEGAWPSGVFPSPDSTRNYTQRYRYDRVGNITKMQHIGTALATVRTAAGRATTPTRSTTRRSPPATGYGRRGSAATARRPSPYRHDPHGNMLNLASTAPGLDIRWDWRDMIRALDLLGGGDAFYNYGIDKQRTRKRIERNGGQRGPHLPRRV